MRIKCFRFIRKLIVKLVVIFKLRVWEIYRWGLILRYLMVVGVLGYYFEYIVMVLRSGKKVFMVINYDWEMGIFRDRVFM